MSSDSDNLDASTAFLADEAAAQMHPATDPAALAAATAQARAQAALTASFATPLDAAMRRGNPRQQHVMPTLFDVRDVVSIPNMALSPIQITALPHYDDESAPMVAAAVAALQGATDYVNRVVAARTGLRQDPELNESAQVLKLDEVQGRHMQAALKVITNADNTLKRNIADTEVAMRAQLPPTALAGEIRAHVRSLPIGERMALVTKAIDSGEVATLSAVLGAGVPSYLVGLEPATVKALTETYNAKRQPLQAKRLALMRAASEKLNDAGSHIMGSIESVMGVRSSTVTRLREKRATARAIAAGSATV